MLTLGGKSLTIQGDTNLSSRIFSLTTNSALPDVLRASRAYLVASLDNLPIGFSHYIFVGHDVDQFKNLPGTLNRTLLDEHYSYLGEGDVLRITPSRNEFRVLFRANSNHNSFLLTERCDNYCLMCSQPPKDIDDRWIIDELRAVISLIRTNPREIGFTGGEPTLLGDDFFDLVGLCKAHLPHTSLHVLSNGRGFSKLSFAKKLAGIGHPDLMVGIPLYSDNSDQHDYVVQSKGAFDQTLRGILNLKYCGQRVEIRIVLHRQSVPRLPKLAEFIARNLLFVDHVALMGLEMIGFTRANLKDLWIDPYDYQDALYESIEILSSYGLQTSIYNQQLCLLKDELKPYYRKSISDWKNEYAEECAACTKASECGGFFSSGLKYGYSKHIRPFV